MASAVPILTVKLIGEENVAVLNNSISWTPDSKFEAVLVMNTADAEKTIDYSVVSKIRTMVFYGTGSFKIKVTNHIGTDPANVIIFETQDFFVFSPTVAFAATIDSIKISTTSATDISIQVRIYGEI